MATSKEAGALDRQVSDVWRIRDCRMGPLTIRLTVPIDPEEDFFDAELVSGTPQYIGYRQFDPERPGQTITFRYSFVTWVKLVERKEVETDGEVIPE